MYKFKPLTITIKKDVTSVTYHTSVLQYTVTKSIPGQQQSLFPKLLGWPCLSECTKSHRSRIKVQNVIYPPNI